jgi:hypothetical protein
VLLLRLPVIAGNPRSSRRDSAHRSWETASLYLFVFRGASCGLAQELVGNFLRVEDEAASLRGRFVQFSNVAGLLNRSELVVDLLEDSNKGLELGSNFLDGFHFGRWLGLGRIPTPQSHGADLFLNALFRGVMHGLYLLLRQRQQ